MPLPWVSTQLGHSDPALTLRTYAHVMPQRPQDMFFADFAVPERPHTAATQSSPPAQRRKSAKKVVTRARFERATPSFGGWCSIQLSYRATTVVPEDHRFIAWQDRTAIGSSSGSTRPSDEPGRFPPPVTSRRSQRSRSWEEKWWGVVDSNHRPPRCEHGALAS